MPYDPGDEKKYFSAIIAALVIIVGAIAFFVWSIISGTEDVVYGPGESAVIVEEKDGVNYLTPGGNNVPESAPYVPAPVTPPPTN